MMLKAANRYNRFRNQYEDGKTGQTWEKAAGDIGMHGEDGTLEDNGVSISEAFFEDKHWHSRISILPVYPAFHEYEGASGNNV